MLLRCLRGPDAHPLMCPMSGPACPAKSGSESWPRGDSWQRRDGRSNECRKLAPGGFWVYVSIEETSEVEAGAQDGRREAWDQGPALLNHQLVGPKRLRIANLDPILQVQVPLRRMGKK